MKLKLESKKANKNHFWLSRQNITDKYIIQHDEVTPIITLLDSKWLWIVMYNLTYIPTNNAIYFSHFNLSLLGLFQFCC